MKKIILLAGLLILAGCGQPSTPSEKQDIPPVSSPIIPQSQNKESSDQPSNWTLVSGDPKDTCSKPRFAGKATIKGWYAYEDVYIETKDWVFNVIKADAEKLPKVYDAKTKQYTNFEKFIISDATPALQESLKKYSKEKPGEITIISYALYCEGLPMVSVGTALNNQSELTYKNATYGFQIIFPAGWENFMVDIDDKQIASMGAVYIHFLIPTTDKTWPGAFLTNGAKVNGYTDVFAITAWNKSEWDKDIDSKECKENPNPDCPFEGSKIGFNDKYVFSISRGNGSVPNNIVGKVDNLFKKAGNMTAQKVAAQTLKFELLP